MAAEHRAGPRRPAAGSGLRPLAAGSGLRPVAAGALVSGTAVSLATSAVLALLSRAEGRRPVRSVNTPSQWVHGHRQGDRRGVTLRHTALGYAIHHAASIFWAAVFHGLRRVPPPRPVLADAAGISALAAAVDYGVVPRRLTPGWERVVTPRAIAATYAVMALALFATARR